MDLNEQQIPHSDSGFAVSSVHSGKEMIPNYDESDISDISDWEILSTSSESSTDMDENYDDFTSDQGEHVDEGWSDRLHPIELRSFTEDVGPNHDLPYGTSPVRFFYLMFEETFFETIVYQTNLYAEQKQRDIPDPTWYETTVDEIKAYFGLHIMMGIHRVPEYSFYWSDDIRLYNQGIAEIMPKHRYDQLTQYLHLTNNEQQPDRNSSNYDPLFKVRPLLEMLNRNFLKYYTPRREMCLDRAKIGFQDRSEFTPYKPPKWGIKVWQLSESTTGYTSQFQLDHVRRDDMEDSRDLGHRVVMELAQPFLRRNYHIYFDHFFISVPLFDELTSNQTYGCGAVSLNSKGLPQDLKHVKLRQNGDKLKRQKGDLLVTVWKYKKQVAFVSNNQQPTDSEIEVGHGRVVNTPDVVTNFCRYIEGINLVDDHRANYTYTHENTKWWKYVLNYCLDLVLINAHQLYIASNKPLPKSKGKFSHLDFRLQVATDLHRKFSKRSKC